MSKPREAASRALMAAAKRAQALALDLRSALLAFEGEPRADTLVLQARRLASDVEEYAVDLGRRPKEAERPIIAAIEAKANITKRDIAADADPIREPVLPGLQPDDWRDRSVSCLDLPAEKCKLMAHFGVMTLGAVAGLVEKDGAAGLGSALGDGSGSNGWAGKVSKALRDYLAEQEETAAAVAGDDQAEDLVDSPAPEIDGVALRPDDPRYYQLGGKPPSADHAGTGDVAKWLAGS